jgi:hypothetical protein
MLSEFRSSWDHCHVALDVPWVGGRVAEGRSQLADRSVEALVESHIGVRRPKPCLQLPAGNNFSGAFQQHGQNTKGLFLQGQSPPALVQLARDQIDPEKTGPKFSAGTGWRVHWITLTRCHVIPVARFRKSHNSFGSIFLASYKGNRCGQLTGWRGLATRRIASNCGGGIVKRKLFTNASTWVLLTLSALGSGHALSDVEGCSPGADGPPGGRCDG